MISRYLPQSTAELIHWYERYVSPLALVAGFLIDNFFLLKRVDLLFGNLALLSYLVIATLGITALNYVESGRAKNRLLLVAAPFLPVVIQFVFGGLFSGYLALYSRSASIAVSWIFVLGIAVLLIGNERFRALYSRLSFQMAMFFTALFSYLIFSLPLLFSAIGPGMFLLAGVVSIGIAALFLYALNTIVPERARESRSTVIGVIGSIFLMFNILYFTNIIPPLPLSLQYAGVYHSVVREGGEYRLLYEPLPWYRAYLNYNTTFHRAPGDTAYIFASVFAPTGLNTPVTHEWQFFNQELGEWVTTNEVVYQVIGGRDGGYRGYTQKSALEEGRWRVSVKTSHGQIIGRVNFTVVDVAVPPHVEEVIR